MTRADETLRLLREGFPGRDPIVERAYRDNRPFRELCDDYRRCRAALDSWRQREDENTDERSREYTELLAELAAEIEVWLQAMEIGSYGPRDVLS